MKKSCDAVPECYAYVSPQNCAVMCVYVCLLTGVTDAGVSRCVGRVISGVCDVVCLSAAL